MEDTSQDDYRRQLAEFWQIPSGARILEVGCGQGDMTSVLAESAGHIADLSYGAPQTLGKATDLIRSGPLGHKIDFRFNCDILQEGAFAGESYDYGVMAHCSWYFSSEEVLRSVFRKLPEFCSHLCFAEWDLEPYTIDQVPHYLAVLIQGQVESFKTSSHANVRTPFSCKTVERLLAENGWSTAQICLPDTTELQDANWEIDACLKNSLREANELGVPPRLYSLLETQVDLIRNLKESGRITPLGSFALRAT